MGRILGSALRQEFENLGKGPDSHKSAMKALKSYVKDLDEKAIPLFLALVSETEETGSEPGEFTVSLFEDLARVHGLKIAPHSETIMSVIIRTLACSAGSFPLQQACSKVVSSVARYCIDPGTPGEKKRSTIHSLCKPLADSLVGSQEHLASGVALCLKAIVDCNNWRFASDEMVNMVCQNVAVGLDAGLGKTYSHMALVIALAKHNPLIVEAYARLLVRSGLRILDQGIMEGNSQKRLLAIQMLNFLMKNLDPESMDSELELIVHEMEKCQNDTMHFVKMAAYETMRTADKIKGEGDPKFNKNCDSVTGSNFSRGSCNKRITVSAVGQSIARTPPEFQDFHSFPGYDSSSLTAHASNDSGNDRWSVNYKHGSYVNGQAEQDELFSGVANGSIVPGSPLVPYGDSVKERTSLQCENHRNGFERSASLTRQGSLSRVGANDFNIFSHSRNMSSEFKQSGSFGATSLRSFRRNTKANLQEANPRHQRHGFMRDPFDELREKREQYSDGSEQSEGAAESICSTNDASTNTTTTTTNSSDNTDEEARAYMNSQAKPQMGIGHVRRGRGKSVLRLGLGFFSIAVAGFASFMWVHVQDDVVPRLVPT